MNDQRHNVVAPIYNTEHAPYRYGAFHIVQGTSSRTTKPFVVSKRTATGEEFVYGTVLHMLLKVLLQIEKLREFSISSGVILAKAGIPVGDEPLPANSSVADHVMDDQEELIEEVLFVTSVRVRILSEIFPDILKTYAVSIYDYEDNPTGSIQLSHIGNLLVHNRYVCVQDQYVVDLYSDKKTLSDNIQLGLKINFVEYITEVERAVRSIMVKDLLKHMRVNMEQLSAASGSKDMVNLHQNLYMMGGLVPQGSNVIVRGPLQDILSRATSKHLKRMYPYGPPKGEVHQSLVIKFTTPRFCWEPNLDEKRIQVSLFVNDERETLVMESGQFFHEMEAAYGDKTLLEAAGFPSRSYHR